MLRYAQHDMSLVSEMILLTLSKPYDFKNDELKSALKECYNIFW